MVSTTALFLTRGLQWRFRVLRIIDTAEFDLAVSALWNSKYQTGCHMLKYFKVWTSTWGESTNIFDGKCRDSKSYETFLLLFLSLFRSPWTLSFQMCPGNLSFFRCVLEHVMSSLWCAVYINILDGHCLVLWGPEGEESWKICRNFFYRSSDCP